VISGLEGKPVALSLLTGVWAVGCVVWLTETRVTVATGRTTGRGTASGKGVGGKSKQGFQHWER
jgi:hypothetical protein